MKCVAVIVLLLGMLPVLVGCEALGAAAAVVTPPEKIEAMYEMPDKATLIVVDDPKRLVNSETTLRRIASGTRAVLEAEEIIVLGGFVGQDELAGYREELGEAYSRTSLANLAMRLGAKQVIHIEVTGFQMELGGNVIRPSIALNVKVFDLDQRMRVFPASVDPETGVDTGETIYPLQSKLPAQDTAGQNATRSIALRDLADQSARDVARLFFDWRMPAPGSTLGTPQ